MFQHRQSDRKGPDDSALWACKLQNIIMALGLVLHYKKAGQSMRTKVILVVYIDAYERDERINRLGRFYSRCRRDF